MSVDIDSLASWTYSDFTLTHVDSQQSITIDVAANLALHEILSAPHWYLPPEFKEDYSLAEESDWVERDIIWARATEDPPVLGIEQTIGAADHVEYTVIELEDDASYGPILQHMADANNDGVANGYTKAHEKSLMRDMVKLLQLADLL